MEQKQHMDDAGLTQVVSFNLGQELFGIDILGVQEINRVVEITSLPDSPPACEGIIDLRGKVIPVINLRTLFGLEHRNWDDDTRIVVCDIAGNMAGLLVDSVAEVLRISNHAIEPAPEMATAAATHYIEGIAEINGRLLILLDMNAIGRVTTGTLTDQGVVS